MDQTDAGRVLAAGRSGIFLSDNGGDWEGLNREPGAANEFIVAAIDPADPQHLLASSNAPFMSLQSSGDGGKSWQQVAQRPGPRANWRALAFAPSDPAVVYAGSSAYVSASGFSNDMPGAGIYISRDRGASWNPANDATSADANVTRLAVDPVDARTVYAATTNHGILKTVDGGQSWVAINQGLAASAHALSVAVHPTASGILYVGLERGGLYRSEDGGRTWKQAAAGLSPEATVRIVFDPTNPLLMYAADRQSGVYSSTDGGKTWTPLKAGLRVRAVNALAISTDGQHLYAATEGEGVFRLDLNGEPPAAKPNR